MQGNFLLVNTTEEFQKLDKKKLLDSATEEIYKSIVDGKALSDPKMYLQKFILILYADLKKYKFVNWTCYPVLFPKDVAFQGTCCPAADVFSDSNSDWCDKLSLLPVEKGFFAVDRKTLEVLDMSLDCVSSPDDVLFTFADPSTDPTTPGWPCRNFIFALLKRYSIPDSFNSLTLLALRKVYKNGVCNTQSSLIIRIPLSGKDFSLSEFNSAGWEKNFKNKQSPRVCDLSGAMDPVKLSESAVDLNLQLMRWRVAPTLNLEAIARQRCLLLGSGTLGCNVARLLMAWGVRHITLLDSGTVSYSNPVRQTLFEFSDCMNGGKLKAETAAQRLRNIFPGVKVESVHLTIPSPGHALGETELIQCEEAITKLEHLISTHDSIFLLTDTRESRWLPTLISSSQQKIVFNAALGFDSFLVMRHGVDRAESGDAHSPKLGCYFCNDVVAPGNSTLDRTLDQQCTVTRPGLSMLASSYLVELFASVAIHPDGVYAEPPSDTSESQNASSSFDDTHLYPLGPPLHQTRSWLSRHIQVNPVTRAFDKCTACGPIVLSAYRERGRAFVLEALRSPDHLEEITGLKQLQIESIGADIIELCDDEDF